MEVLLSFIAGLVLASIIAIAVAKKVIDSRTGQAGLSARLEAESAFKGEKARLQADLEHSKERVR